MAEKVIRLAIPNKGRIAEPVRELIEKSGLHIRSTGDRLLLAKTVDPHVEIIFARPIDIPGYVSAGIADLGITGQDMVKERRAEVRELLDLGLGRANLVLAVMEESSVKSAADLEGARIATEFPEMTRDYFREIGVNVTVVQVSGACEATPHLGIADAIADLSSSGATLETNHLRVIGTLFPTSTVLVANLTSFASCRPKIDELTLAFESVVRARGQCYLMMNVARDSLPVVRDLLPGLSGPTVMDVASSGDLVAVHAVVGEERIYTLINQLRLAGARDILVLSVERMVR